MLISVHLLLALGWLGAEMITVLVIGPGLQKMSVQAMREFVTKVIPLAVTYVEWMIVGTGVTGFLLGFATPSQVQASGDIVLAGIVLALLAAGVEVIVTTPSFKKMISLGNVLLKSGVETRNPEMGKYERRVRWGSLAGTVLLVAVLVLMVITGL
jgi:hypothetical protein